MPNAALPEIEIFRAGRHTAVDGTVVEISNADLEAIASSYDPALGEAPHVVGHPKFDAPAYGWIKKLEARDGILVATQSDQVDPAFAAMTAAGSFKKRSASFFLPTSPGNPKPGQMYLRHVGWLGAAAPAVTGLRDVQFAADVEGVVEFAVNVTVSPWLFRTIGDIFRRLRDRIVETEGVEKADLAIPSWSIDSIIEAAAESDATASPSFAAPAAPSSEPIMSQQNQSVDFAARESAISTREQAIAAREQALRESEGKARRAVVVDFAAGLVKAGKLLPRQQAPIVELLVALESAEKPQTLNFAAADGTPTAIAAGDALRTFLGELPVQVDFAERSQGQAISDTVNFAAPSNTLVDRDRLELHGKALAYQQSHPNMAYLDAVRAVGG